MSSSPKFIIDDSDSDSIPVESLPVSQPDSIQTHPVALPEQSESVLVVESPPPPDTNKPVPPPPPTDDEDDEEEIPELYLPQLVSPSMFLPIPNTDPLSTLLTKYIPNPELRPVRDTTGDWQRVDFHSLVMSNSWRALARMARDRLVTTDPEDLALVLNLWHLRLSALARLRLFNQTSAECTNLFSVLTTVEPLAARTHLLERVLPFELDVMYARVKYWSGDHMGYLDTLAALLTRCRTSARSESATARSAPTKLQLKARTAVAMWQERGARICLILASQLIEMKDFAAATSLLEPLCMQAPALRAAVVRVYLQGGHLRAAMRHAEVLSALAEEDGVDVEVVALSRSTKALVAAARGEWVSASTELRALLESEPDNLVAVNNLAVTLLSEGKLKEGIDVLESALRTSPARVTSAEPFLFNLSTLYELRSAVAADRKRALLIEVAKLSGDGLRATCLKMPTN